MKKGDKVRIHDGSYSMMQDDGGELVPSSGTVLIAEGGFEVLKVGKFIKQTENSTAKALEIKKEVNNLMLRSLKDKNRIVWTQMRFCSNM